MLTLARLVATTADHLIHIADNLRDEDVAELAAKGPGSSDEKLANAVDLSESVWTLMLHGVPVAVMGLAVDNAGRFGSPWLLGTREIDDHPRAFVRVTRDLLRAQLHRVPYFINMVYSGSKRSIRFLKAVGFTIGDPMEYGTEGKLFHPFWMIRDV